MRPKKRSSEGATRGVTELWGGKKKKKSVH